MAPEQGLPKQIENIEARLAQMTVLFD